ncbi:MAG: hypothetical protein IJW20_04510 [Clostridia bacterium]|nr:hypothetical protein [Clostridia bacterium]
MNYYFLKKESALELIEKIEKNLIKNKKNLQKAFDLDYKEWEIKISLEKLIELIAKIKEKEYLPKFTKQEIVSGVGKIVLITNQNPYLIFNFCLNAIYTNNYVDVMLEEKMLATNKVLLEIVKKSIEELKLDSNIINYLEANKNEIVSKQDDYDILYYFGNKKEYIDFSKRIHIDSKFENFGEMYIYIEDNIFEDILKEIDKFAYINEIKVNYFENELEKNIEQINKNNNINKISVIFTKNIDNAYKFIKYVKSENVFINLNPIEFFKYDVDINKLVFKKKIYIK